MRVCALGLKAGLLAGLILWLGMGPLWGQEVDVTSVRFIPNSEDSTSNVTVSGGVGSIFVNQVVKFEFAYVKSPVTSSVTVSVTADPLNDGAPIILTPDKLLGCQTAPAGTSTFSDSRSCAGIPLSVDKTVIRISFNSSELTNNVGEFDLSAEIEDDAGSLLDTADQLLRLQVLGVGAVDLAIEGPVVLQPLFPKQGDRITVNFLITNKDRRDSGKINSVDFSIRIPGRTDFTPTTFLELNCFVENQSCFSLANSPLEIAPLASKRVTLQFISSQLDPTASGQAYVLRMVVNAISRGRETGTEGAEIARSNNSFDVNFTVAQPDRNLTLTLFGGARRFGPGELISFDMAVSNQTSLVVENNSLSITLQREDPDTRAFSRVEPFNEENYTCTPNPLDADTGDTCGNFSLFFVETKRFSLAFSSDDLSPDVFYRLTIAATGPNGESGGSLSVQTVDFIVESQPTPATPGGGVFRPELRPVDLRIVPSATVEQGVTLVLFSLIKNSGNLEAKSIQVTFNVERESTDVSFTPLQFVHFFPRLGVGLTLEARQALETKDLAPGSYRVRVHVSLQDPGTSELDPNNNVLETLINVVAKQDSGTGS